MNAPLGAGLGATGVSPQAARVRNRPAWR